MVRMAEDWVLLTLGALLVYVSVRAFSYELWLLLTLALLMLGVTGLMFSKKVRARWCVDCQAPMDMVPRENRPNERLYYRCEQCGRKNDSGLESRWPE